MKNISKNRIFVVVYLLLIGIAFCGCKRPADQRESRDGYSIVVIDSCEYIEVSFCPACNNGYYSITHKGNCKFCTERNKKY